MHFSDTDTNRAKTTTRVAVVAGLHIVLGIALIHGMKVKLLPPHGNIIELFQVAPEVKIEPPPPPPPDMKKVTPTDVVKPQAVAETVPEVEPLPLAVPSDTPGTILGAAAPAESSAAAPAAEGAGMNTAVLAEGCATPAYPKGALRNNETGTVTLALLIGTDGRVARSRVETSSGSRELDKAASNALSMCKFKPAMVAGVATQAWSAISYVWKLES